MTAEAGATLKKLATFFLVGYFCSTTFSHALGQNFLGLALILIFIFLIKAGQFRFDFKFSYFFIFILIYIGWSIMAALFSSTPTDSLIEIREEWLFLMIPAVAFLFAEKKIIKHAYTIFAISVILISLYAIWQHFSGIDFYHDRALIEAPSFGYTVRGFFSHRLTFGNYFAIAAVFILGIAPYAENMKSKILLYAAFVAASIAVVFTYSRGPILILIASIFLFLIWVGRKKIKPLIIISLILIVVIFFAAPDITDRYISSFKVELKGEYPGSRLSIWRTAGRMALDNPIIGVGSGNFMKEYVNYRDITSDRAFNHAHNDILNSAAKCGFPYALFYLAFWVAIIFRMIIFLRHYKQEGVIRGVGLGCLLATLVFFLSSIYEATFADEEIRLLLMAVWGLFLAVERLVKLPQNLTENIEKA